jgi:hypothetical protein
MFKRVAKPGLMPEIWCFPQVVYGNWRSLGSSEEDVSDEYQDSIECDKGDSYDKLADDGEMNEDDGDSDGNDEDNLDIDDEIDIQDMMSDDAPGQYVRICDTRNCGDSDDSDASWDDGFNLTAIEKGDHLIIYCDNLKDACRLELPNLPGKFVFVAKVDSILMDKDNEKRAKLKGKFYMNKQKNIENDLQLKRKVETMDIHETSVLHIYRTTPFKLTPENINEIEEFLRKKI